jgi:hypothetical protein
VLACDISDLHFHFGARVNVDTGHIKGDHLSHVSRLLFRGKGFTSEIMLDLRVKSYVEEVALHHAPFVLLKTFTVVHIEVQL